MSLQKISPALAAELWQLFPSKQNENHPSTFQMFLSKQKHLKNFYILSLPPTLIFIIFTFACFSIFIIFTFACFSISLFSGPIQESHTAGCGMLGQSFIMIMIIMIMLLHVPMITMIYDFMKISSIGIL